MATGYALSAAAIYANWAAGDGPESEPEPAPRLEPSRVLWSGYVDNSIVMGCDAAAVRRCTLLNSRRPPSGAARC